MNFKKVTDLMAEQDSQAERLEEILFLVSSEEPDKQDRLLSLELSILKAKENLRLIRDELLKFVS